MLKKITVSHLSRQMFNFFKQSHCTLTDIYRQPIHTFDMLQGYVGLIDIWFPRDIEYVQVSNDIVEYCFVLSEVHVRIQPTTGALYFETGCAFSHDAYSWRW